MDLYRPTLLLLFLLSLHHISATSLWEDALEDRGTVNPRQPPSGPSSLCQELVFVNTAQRPFTCVDGNTDAAAFLPIPSSEGDLWPNQPPNNISRYVTFLIRDINAQYTGGNTTFIFFVAGLRNQALGIKIYFDFDGDTYWDRFELFQPVPLINVVQQGKSGTIFNLNSASVGRQAIGRYGNFSSGTLRVDLWSATPTTGALLFQTGGSRSTISSSSILNIPYTNFVGTEKLGKGPGEQCQTNAECETTFLCVGPVGLPGLEKYCSPPCTVAEDCRVMDNSNNYNIRIPEAFRQCNPFHTNRIRRGGNCISPDSWPDFAGPNPGRAYCGYICPENTGATFVPGQVVDIDTCRCLPGFFAGSTPTLNFTCQPALSSGACSLIQPCFSQPNPAINTCDVSGCNIECRVLEGQCRTPSIQGCSEPTPVTCENCNYNCLMQRYPETPRTVDNVFLFPGALEAGIACCSNCTSSGNTGAGGTTGGASTAATSAPSPTVGIPTV